MTTYRQIGDTLRPVLQIAMPRSPRIYAPGATMHVVARCNNREFYFAAPEDFEILLDHLGEMSSAYGVRLFAYTLMSSHIHLLLQSPDADVLGRPMRWFMTQTAKTFHRLRNRCGHFWERRYRACLVEDDLYALAALRYMDRNPVRARHRGGSCDLCLVELRELCPGAAKSSHPVPSQLPGIKPLRQSTAETLSRNSCPQFRSES